MNVYMCGYRYRYRYRSPNYECFEKEEEQSLLFHIGTATDKETHHLLHTEGVHGANPF